MEGISASLYKEAKSYWRRKGYERIDGSTDRRSRKNRPVVLETTSETDQRRRFGWRFKISPKLRFFRFSSTKKSLRRLRDKYVKMMVRFANSKLFINGFGGGGSGSSIEYGLGNAHHLHQKYDEKVVVEIYKTLIEQGHLKPFDGML